MTAEIALRPRAEDRVNGVTDEASSKLERVALILESVAAATDGLTLNEIAARLDLPVPTVHRLTGNLLRLGYLEGARGRSRYHLGMRLLRLAHSGLSTESIRVAVAAVLQDLADQFDETAYMVRLHGYELKLLTHVFPSLTSRTVIHPGDHFPVNATSSGKAIIAFQHGAIADRAIEGPHEKYRPGTLTDSRKIRLELARVREDGYAVSDDEYDAGVYAVACPVHVGGAGVLYSVGVVGLRERFLMKYELDDIVAALKGAADKLGQVLLATRGGVLN
jgi:DNA-binding IclR family transcriptional regulator